MKRIIFLFIILLVAIWLGTWIVKDPGYVLIAYQHWTLETPLWFGIIVALLFLLLLNIFYHLTRALFSLPAKARTWRLKRRRRQSYLDVNTGVLQLMQGNWQVAEKYFQRVIPGKRFLLISYLAAAKAAQAQGAHMRCDHYLQQARQRFPGAQFTIDIVQAQWLIAREQFARAVIILRRLNAQLSKHPMVLNLLHKVFLRLQDWHSFRLLLPELKRHNIMAAQEYERMEMDTYCALLDDAAEHKEKSKVIHVWSTFPRKIQKDPTVLAVYARHLLDCKAHQAAEKELFIALKKQWDDRLIELYGLVIGAEPNKQLARAEKWLSAHPDHAGLLLSLGRLCLRQQLWGKARNYLEKSVAIAPARENCLALARLLEQLGERDLALKYYREGLLLSVSH